MDEIEQKEVIDRCREFLHRSADRYSNEILEQEESLEALGGKFWEQRDLKKKWKIGKRPVIHHDIFSKIANAVASPYSSSPFHVNVNQGDGIQDLVNAFEGSFDAKVTYQKGFKRGVQVGAGYVVIGVNDDGSPMMEFAQQQSSIAIDPDCSNPDCSDAEAGATIRYVSIGKARRDFGEDVIPANYPDRCQGLDLSGCQMWGNKADSIQIVNYYEKDANGVTLYKICGCKVVAEPIVLPIDRIPIVRFAGYSVYDKNKGIGYEGVVQRLWDAQISYDLVWTKQMTRMQENIKAKAMVGLTAISGMSEELKNLGNPDLEAFVWNDRADAKGNRASEPKIMNESFNSADLMEVLNNIRSCIPDISGIPLDGITGVEKTATEVLTQQVNNESNVQELYTNAESANRTIGRIIVMLVNGGKYMDFSLENGPAIITTNQKRRQEINAIAQYYPEDKKMLLAIPMAETIDSTMAKGIGEFTKANLPDGLKLPGDNSVGAVMYALKQTQKQFDQAIVKANELNAANAELQKQVDELTRANSDMKQQLAMEWAKFRVDTNLKVQQTQFENSMEERKFEQEQEQIILDAQNKKDANAVKAAEAIARVR